MFSNPQQVASLGIEPRTYRTISDSLYMYQCATLPHYVMYDNVASTLALQV